MRFCGVVYFLLLEITLQGQFRLTFTNEPIYTGGCQQAFYYASKKPNYSGFSIWWQFGGVTVLWFCLLLMMEKCPGSAIMLDWRYGLDDGPPLENYGKNRVIFFLKSHSSTKANIFRPLRQWHTPILSCRSIRRGSDNCCWLAILEIQKFSQGFPLNFPFDQKFMRRRSSNSNLVFSSSSSDENSSPNSSCPITLDTEFMLMLLCRTCFSYAQKVKSWVVKQLAQVNTLASGHQLKFASCTTGTAGIWTLSSCCCCCSYKRGRPTKPPRNFTGLWRK